MTTIQETMRSQGRCPAHPEPGSCAANNCTYWIASDYISAKVAAGICCVMSCNEKAAHGDLCAGHAHRATDVGKQLSHPPVERAPMHWMPYGRIIKQ